MTRQKPPGGSYTRTDNRYCLVAAEKSYCPKCGRSVALLAAEDIFATRKPAFYICFTCQHVAQVGIGPVEVITEQRI